MISSHVFKHLRFHLEIKCCFPLKKTSVCSIICKITLSQKRLLFSYMVTQLLCLYVRRHRNTRLKQYSTIYVYLLKRQCILSQIIICSWSHKIFKNVNFHTCILKSSNQSSVFIGCAILIGCLSSKSTKYVFICFFTIRPGLDIINYFLGKNYYNNSLNFSSRKKNKQIW